MSVTFPTLSVVSLHFLLRISVNSSACLQVVHSGGMDHYLDKEMPYYKTQWKYEPEGIKEFLVL